MDPGCSLKPEYYWALCTMNGVWFALQKQERAPDDVLRAALAACAAHFGDYHCQAGWTAETFYAVYRGIEDDLFGRGTTPYMVSESELFAATDRALTVVNGVSPLILGGLIGAYFVGALWVNTHR